MKNHSSSQVDGCVTGGGTLFIFAWEKGSLSWNSFFLIRSAKQLWHWRLSTKRSPCVLLRTSWSREFPGGHFHLPQGWIRLFRSPTLPCGDRKNEQPLGWPLASDILPLENALEQIAHLIGSYHPKTGSMVMGQRGSRQLNRDEKWTLSDLPPNHLDGWWSGKPFICFQKKLYTEFQYI